jgi:hypothetical protein
LRTATNPALLNYDRRYKVPDLDGTEPKLCNTCNQWFPAAMRERTCFPCLPATSSTPAPAAPVRYLAGAGGFRCAGHAVLRRVRNGF